VLAVGGGGGVGGLAMLVGGGVGGGVVVVLVGGGGVLVVLPSPSVETGVKVVLALAEELASVALPSFTCEQFWKAAIRHPPDKIVTKRMMFTYIPPV